MVRGKFQVTEVAEALWGQKRITLTPQHDTTIPEDVRFSKATPSGTIQLYVDNPPAAKYLKLGDFFYVDFIDIKFRITNT